jgi:hypothetical protein
MMRAFLIAAFVPIVLAGGPSGRAGAASGDLEDGARSVEALVGRFLDVLAARDAEALRRLRVSEREYLTIVVPGHVEPGSPPQKLPEEQGRVFWELLDTRSRYAELGLLDEFGGSVLRVKRIDYAKGTHRYAGYTAYRRLVLTLASDDGGERELRTGSIAEVGGRFKFVSFVRD